MQKNKIVYKRVYIITNELKMKSLLLLRKGFFILKLLRVLYGNKNKSKKGEYNNEINNFRLLGWLSYKK